MSWFMVKVFVAELSLQLKRACTMPVLHSHNRPCCSCCCCCCCRCCCCGLYCCSGILYHNLAWLPVTTNRVPIWERPNIPYIGETRDRYIVVVVFAIVFGVALGTSIFGHTHIEQFNYTRQPRAGPKQAWTPYISTK